MSADLAARQTEFRNCFHLTSRRVYAYVRRHCDESDCDDVIAEVYLAAWRHFADLPTDPVPWLIGTARKVLANHWRSRGRRQRLATDLAGIESMAAPDLADQAIDRLSLIHALATLSEQDRDLLLMVGWDGLDTDGVAAALDCSADAARTRLSRARRRLLAQLDQAESAPLQHSTTAEGH
ncbi:MAG: sigma-70 family RNA polymerase sigma factor [Propionicimonas sp.]